MVYLKRNTFHRQSVNHLRRWEWHQVVNFSCVLSHVWFFATPCTVAHQASLFMGLFQQEYWSELPFPTPGDPSDLGIEATSPGSPALTGKIFAAAPPRKPTCLFGPFQTQVHLRSYKLQSRETLTIMIIQLIFLPHCLHTGSVCCYSPLLTDILRVSSLSSFDPDLYFRPVQW